MGCMTVIPPIVKWLGHKGQITVSIAIGIVVISGIIILVGVLGYGLFILSVPIYHVMFG